MYSVFSSWQGRAWEGSMTHLLYLFNYDTSFPCMSTLPQASRPTKNNKLGSGQGGAQMQVPPESLHEAKSLFVLLIVFFTYVA